MQNLHRCGPMFRRLLTQSNQLAAGRTRQRMGLTQGGFVLVIVTAVTAVWQSRISSPSDG